MDCGGGNRIMGWHDGLSTIEYRSAKSPEQAYLLFFGQDGGDEWYPCDVSRRMRPICVDRQWNAWDSVCSSMSPKGAPSRRRAALSSTDLDFREILGLERGVFRDF